MKMMGERRVSIGMGASKTRTAVSDLVMNSK